jgi:hypothetical protein
MVTDAPERTLDQRMTALRGANVIRSARAQLKKDIKAGRRSALDVLMNVPDYCETMKVFDLLLVVPKIGRVKANKVLVRARVSPSKTLLGMSERQRHEIVTLLRGGW